MNSFNVGLAAACVNLCDPNQDIEARGDGQINHKELLLIKHFRVFANAIACRDSFLWHLNFKGEKKDVLFKL